MADDYDDLWDDADAPAVETKPPKKDPVAEKYMEKKKQDDNLFDDDSPPQDLRQPPSVGVSSKEISDTVGKAVSQATGPLLEQISQMETRLISPSEVESMLSTAVSELQASFSEQISSIQTGAPSAPDQSEELRSVVASVSTLSDSVEQIRQKLDTLVRNSNDREDAPAVDRGEIERQIRRDLQREFDDKMSEETDRMKSQIAVAEDRRKKAEDEAKVYEEEVTALTDKVDSLELAAEKQGGSGNDDEIDVDAIKAQYEDQISQYEQQLQTVTAQLEAQGSGADSSELEQQLSEARDESNRLQQEMESASRAEQELRDDITKKESRIAELENELAAANAQEEEKQQPAPTATVSPKKTPVQEARDQPRRSLVQKKVVTPAASSRTRAATTPAQPIGGKKLSAMKVKELKDVAENLGIDLPTFVTKGKIIKAILATDQGRTMFPEDEQPAKVTSAIPPSPSQQNGDADGPVDDEFEKMNYKQLVNKAKELNVDIGMFAPAPKLRQLIRAHLNRGG